MPADLRYESLRAMVEVVQRRVRSIERNEGIAFNPGTRNPQNPLDADLTGGNQMNFAATQTGGYDSVCGLNVIPFISDLSKVPFDTGTAQAGGADTLTLRAGASAVDAEYEGEYLTLWDGTGCGQIKLIITYVGATKVATVDSPWTVVPDNTTEYTVGDHHLVMS